MNYWNDYIRSRLGFENNILNVGEIIVAQKNTISLCGSSISKGDFGRIVSISDVYSCHAGLNFSNVFIEFESNLSQKKVLNVKILVDSLYTNYGSLESSLEKNLVHYANKHNERYRQTQNETDDKLLSSLRVRYAYAITCHKAQGGEWDNVVICPSNWNIDAKWLYTSVTRARKSVCLYAA